MEKENRLSKIILDTAFEIHTKLGPGLLESVYETCLVHDLRQQGLKVQTQKHLEIEYKSLRISKGYRLDVLVEDAVVIEVKCADAINDVHLAQTLTYLKLGKYKLGLILNFQTCHLKNGIRRLILNS